MRDTFDLLRTVTLDDEIESQLFAGMPLGLADEALALVPSGGWAIDIGANVGVVAGQLAHAVGPSGRVDAFEPVPRNLGRLQEVVADNRLAHVRLWPVALGSQAGTLLLRMPAPGHSGWASATASWNVTGTLEVEQTTLDHVVFGAEHSDRNVAFCKIDVEGAEFDVLRGARRVLAEHRPLLYVECNDLLLRDAGTSSRELIEDCLSYGYEVHPAWAQRSTSTAGRVVDLLFVPRVN